MTIHLSICQLVAKLFHFQRKISIGIVKSDRVKSMKILTDWSFYYKTTVPMQSCCLLELPVS